MKQLVTMLAALAAALLSACAGLTPGEVRAKGTSFTSQHGGAPETIARCIQRNIEAQSSYHLVDVRPQDGWVEVVARGVDTGWVQTGVIGIYELRPSKIQPGSTVVRGWISPEEPNDHRQVFNGDLLGC